MPNDLKGTFNNSVVSIPIDSENSAIKTNTANMVDNLEVGLAQSEKRLQEGYDKLDSRSDTTVTDKFLAGLNAYQDSYGGKIYQFLSGDNTFFRNEDKNFMSQWGQEEIDKYMQSNGIEDKYRGMVRDTVSNEHLVDVTNIIKNRQRREAEMQDTLTSTQQTIASVGSAIFDVDMALSLASGGLALGAKTIGLGAKVNRAIQLSSTVGQVGIASSVYAIDEDTSLLEVALVGGISAFADYKVIGAMNKNSIINAASKSKDAVKVARAEQISKGMKKLEEIKASKSKAVEEELIREFDKSAPDFSKIDELINNVKSSKASEFVKRRIKTMSAVTKSIGFKIFRAKVDKLLKTPNLSEEAKVLIHQEGKDIMAIADDIAMNIEAIKADLTSLAKGDKSVAEEVLNVYRGLHKDNLISKSAIDKLEYAFKKGDGTNITHPKITVSIDKNGKGGKLKINGKPVKKLPFAIAAALGATIASADNGENGVTSSELGIALIALLAVSGVGVNAISAIKNSGSLLKAVKSMGDSLTYSRALDNTKGFRAKLGAIADRSRTSLFETIKPLLDNTVGKTNQLVRDMYFDPFGSGTTIERIKQQVFSSHYLNFAGEQSKYFKEWMKDGGITKAEEISSLFKNLSIRAKFNRMVYENVEYGLHSENKAIVKASESWTKSSQNMLKTMIEAGVKGSDNFKTVVNYVPRIIDRSNVQKIMTNVSEETYDNFVESFSKVFINSKEPKKVAKAYVDAVLMSSRTGGETISVDTIKDMLAKKGLDENLAYEISDALGIGGDTLSRLKRRIDMDKSLFEPVELRYLDGKEPLTVTIDDFFQTDIMSLSSDFFSKASGAVAFTDKGYKSIDEAIEIVNKSKSSHSIKKMMINDIEALAGNPVLSYSAELDRSVRSLSNLTIAGKMLMSVVSLLSEGTLTVFNRMVTSMAKLGVENADLMKTEYGKDSMLFKLLMSEDGLGLGLHNNGKTFGAFSTIDEFGVSTGGERGLNAMHKVSEIARDVTLHVMPFVKSSDYLTKLNISDVLERLHLHINGNRPFSKTELGSFDMSKSLERKLKSSMKFNKNGKLADMDYTKWDRELQQEFKGLVDRMMQKRIQEATMGTTAAYTRNSALGKFGSVLIKYPMSAYANIGGFLGKGLLNMDANVMAQSMVWLGAGAVQSVIRKELSDKSYDDKDIIIGALTNHPFFGIESVVSSFGNPASVQTLNEITQYANLYNYSE